MDDHLYAILAIEELHDVDMSSWAEGPDFRKVRCGPGSGMDPKKSLSISLGLESSDRPVAVAHDDRLATLNLAEVLAQMGF